MTIINCEGKYITVYTTVMPGTHRRHGLVHVSGVNRIGDKSRLFSVVLAAFRDWTKQFLNSLSPTVLTCRHSRHGRSCLVRVGSVNKPLEYLLK